MTGPENLAQYVRRVLREKGLTVADAERRAGGEISKAYICDISNGKFRSVTVQKLQALARALAVPEDEVFAVARGLNSPTHPAFAESEFSLACQKYQNLSPGDQEAVRILLDALLREMDRRLRHERLQLYSRRLSNA